MTGMLCHAQQIMQHADMLVPASQESRFKQICAQPPPPSSLRDLSAFRLSTLVSWNKSPLRCPLRYIWCKCCTCT